MLALLSIAILAAAPAPPPLPCRELGPEERVVIDLADVPLKEIARLVSCALGKNILFDPPALAGGSVTVLGPRPVGRADLRRLWEAVLADHGLVAERHGAFERVRKAR